ncbi:hypothetical protein F5J12DRAFT_899193 [Pisolithus orientalis]|uniref:uncharacterized protein n=1 Tax=Pisolithus orientalis TaxID=936130 RepID=UPI002224C33D|nr:uncharacterized protein F5J12DRAFT_899193 [Pisolithus orientalis]KAI5984803.1 hypothetical protein F5J12DRAFT_899193 [Pisolithus orientalis]
MSLAQTAPSASGAFDSIPIIDIGHASTLEERAALARQIRDACTNVGFFYIKNHGVPEETIDKALSAMKAFFSLSTEAKMKSKLHHRQGAHYRGYEPLLDSNINPTNKGDLYESFMIGWEKLVPEENVGDTPAVANRWPSEPAGFREAFLDYYHATLGVAKGFQLRHNPMMRGLHYPPQTGPEDERIMGIGAHSDFECFTILWQEPGIQALQILNSEKQWINATPVPGTLVINIADLLSRWTNDVFRSTVHRAINRSGFSRYSIPMFIGANSDVVVEPIPSLCIS